MTIYVLQYRRSGEDYHVSTFNTLEQANIFAAQFLYNMWYSFGRGIGFYEALLPELEHYCFINDIAYIEITTHNLPTNLPTELNQ